MKTLKESLLDDIDVQMNKGQNDILIEWLFDTDDLTRQNGVETLYKIVIETNPKPITSINKLKMSDKYFIHFSDVRIGSHDDKRINNINILKRNDDKYTVLSVIGIGRASYWKPIVAYTETLGNLNRIRSIVMLKDAELYEVPEKLNDLFKQIEMEANKHIK
jgi:hypothetical protein